MKPIRLIVLVLFCTFSIQAEEFPVTATEGIGLMASGGLAIGSHLSLKAEGRWSSAPTLGEPVSRNQFPKIIDPADFKVNLDSLGEVFFDDKNPTRSSSSLFAGIRDGDLLVIEYREASSSSISRISFQYLRFSEEAENFRRALEEGRIAEVRSTEIYSMVEHDQRMAVRQERVSQLRFTRAASSGVFVAMLLLEGMAYTVGSDYQEVEDIKPYE
jgi:hypothetical protein